MKKGNERAEEFLRDYAKVIEEAQAAEFSKYMDDAASEKDAEKQKDTMPKRGKKSRQRLLRYAAVFAAVIIVAGVVIPVDEVSAWVVWKFDALFGENDDHTEIKPNDENDFIQYYVAEIPEGFEVVSEQADEKRIHIQYSNSSGDYIMLTQMPRELYITSFDSECRETYSEVIGNFEVLVNEGEDDCAFELLTDEVAILIYTNAGYDTGKKVIEKLKEF